MLKPEGVLGALRNHFDSVHAGFMLLMHFMFLLHVCIGSPTSQESFCSENYNSGRGETRNKRRKGLAKKDRL